MRSLLLVLLWAAPLAAVAGQGQPIPDATLREGTLSFDAKASAGDFTGTTSTVSGQMTGGELATVRGFVQAPTRSLVTGNGRRDRDLNKSMESEKYPAIRFDLDGVTPRGTRGDTVDVTLAGRFTIHGVTREAEFPASVVIRPEAIRVRATTPLNLKDYKIGGLTRAFGMLRMYEEIRVRVDLTFAPGGKGVD
jgi:polyisoprenoid-binding protein YceI